MLEFFKTVFVLSISSLALTLFLLFLKPVTSKSFSAHWQYYTWVAVLLSMIIPVYKLIPAIKVQKLLAVSPKYEFYKHVFFAPHLAACIWEVGLCIYLIIVISSYIINLTEKYKYSVAVNDNAVLKSVKQELKIKRNIKMRISPLIQSPLLVGVVFPVIYLPCKDLPDEKLRMVLLHELTHYKRKDLLIKWLSLFVNAVHWFNPLAYLLRANISEACEISCDTAVTKNMSDTEQKIYINTIISLIE